jgi:transcriptional regulator GlxA family with amidase domain
MPAAGTAANPPCTGCSAAISTAPRLIWLLKERMARAAELVANTTLPCREIATLVGIASPYDFSMLFRKFHGHGARRYRTDCRRL